MTNYDNGRRFEWAVRDHLIADGYDVFRSAGSKTKVDMTAVKTGQLLFVQCKRDGKISPAERAKLLQLATLIDCAVPVLAWKEFGKAQVLLAVLTGPGPKDRRPFHTDQVVAA
jgi:Holliday junction resolvase